MKKLYKKYQIGNIKKIGSTIIILTLLSFHFFPISSASSIKEPTFSQISQKTINESISVHDQTVNFNLTYSTKYSARDNTTFLINSDISSGHSMIVINYLQIFYDSGTLERQYQFISNVGKIVSPGNGLSTTSTTKMTSSAYSNQSAKIWFKMGYKINNTFFNQFSNELTSNNTVNLIGDIAVNIDEEGDGFYFLFWEVSLLEFTLIISGIISGIALLTKFKRKKAATKARKIIAKQEKIQNKHHNKEQQK